MRATPADSLAGLFDHDMQLEENKPDKGKEACLEFDVRDEPPIPENSVEEHPENSQPTNPGRSCQFT
jgi:hypothetical protein